MFFISFKCETWYAKKKDDSLFLITFSSTYNEYSVENLNN